MAEEPEKRMLFDLRGRRKRVIQVIYVILAIIMAASLVVIGLPGGINPFGNNTTSLNKDAAEANVERAEDLEQRIQTKPNNVNLSRELIRARFAAARSLYSIDDETGQASITEDANTQYQLAAQAWKKYLKQTNNKPDPEVAQLMAGVFFELSQASTVAQFQNNIAQAARAQEAVVAQALKDQADGGANPANQLAALAMYQYYSQDYAAADRNRDKAIAAANSEAERKQLRQSLNAYRAEAKRIGKQIDRAIKQARKDGGESLQNPLGGLGSNNSLGAPGAAPSP